MDSQKNIPGRSISIYFKFVSFDILLIDINFGQFKIALILMLSPHPSNKLQNSAIISFYLTLLLHIFLLFRHIKHNPRWHAGDTIKQRLSQIHLPFAIPRSNYFLLVLFLGVDWLQLIIYYFISYFLLVHCQYIQSLIEFNTLAGSDLREMVLV